MRPSFQLVFLATAVILLSVSEIHRLYLTDAAGSIVSRVAFLALFPALLLSFTIREWTMTSLALLLSIGLLVRHDTQSLMVALDRAAFFAAFIYLVTLLKEAAQRSRSVLDLGVYMTRQPQGRRYFSLALGGHFLGVLLNFGAISLLTPLIQRGAKAMASETVGGLSAAELEQQQISALLRGFSWMILWAPTALTQAVLMTSFPSANAALVIPLGLGASIVMILIGRVFDRRTWRHHLKPEPANTPSLPKPSARRFFMICAGLIASTFAMALSAQVSAAIALMLVAPIVMIAWICAQNFVADPDTAVQGSVRSLKDVFLHSVKDPARSALILGTAGFIGVTAAALAPVDKLATALSISTMPTWMFLAALPVLITIGGQLALSPIMVVVFLAAVINELPVLPADPSVIVFALGAGWALSMTASPNASATLLISAVTKIPPTTLTWRWNGAYAATCYCAFLSAFWILAA